MKNLITKKTNIFKVAFIIFSVLLVAFAISIFASNQAKAETNGSVTITHTITPDPGEINGSVYVGWVEPGSMANIMSMKWTSGIDVIETYKAEHNVTKIDYYVGPQIKDLELTMKDDSGMIRGVTFYVPYEYQSSSAWKWFLNGAQTSLMGSIDVTSGNFNFNFKEAPATFNITGTVATTENAATPIVGAQVKYYKQDGSEVSGASAVTGNDGAFTINDVSIDNAPGFIEVTHDDFEKIDVNITAEEAETGSVDLGEIQMDPEDDDAEIIVKGAEHHNHFHCTIIATIGGEQQTITKDVDEIGLGEATVPVNTTYYLDESGSLRIHYINPSGEDFQNIIQPIGEDGYVVDKWNSNGVDLVVGQEYTITSGDPIENIVTYKASDANPQTGDSLPFVVIAISIIALLAGGLMLRRSFK